jgi:hypothetical protein
VTDRLRPLWDFEDLDGNEQRLRSQLDSEETGAGRAEVLTQLARVEGLRGDYDASERLLHEAEAVAGASDVARVRIDLERGRKLRSSGDADASMALFEAAFERASAAGEHYLAAARLPSPVGELTPGPISPARRKFVTAGGESAPRLSFGTC